MSNKAIVDFLFMLLFSAVLIVTTHQLSSSTKRVEQMAIDAEGRIGTLELFRENACRDIPELSDCDIYSEER